MSNLRYLQLINPGKCDFTHEELKVLEASAGSSFYLFDAGRLQKNIKDLKEMLGAKAELCFSMKANPWLAKEAGRWADYLEICSPGELRRCLRERIDPKKMVLDGLMKTEEEVVSAIRHGVQRISVDSMGQMELVGRIAKEAGEDVHVLLRLSCGNQFGMEEEEIIRIIGDYRRDNNITIEGLHYYSGTQKKNSSEIAAEFEQLDHRIGKIERESGYSIKTLEIGGGAGVPYFREEAQERYEDVWDVIMEKISCLSERLHIVYEAGRIVAAPAGVYITKVMECKRRKGREILILDGGMHHLSYFGQIAGRKTPFIQVVSDGEYGEEEVTLCGSLCTAQDILAKNICVKGAVKGTYIIFQLTGAYSVTECCSEFLSRAKPALLMKTDHGELSVLRDRERIEFDD
ncbi:alanine racemase [Bariatricus sp. SGI.154]|uniref:alanine racemase n=1 Tax=Bariatricus sp. SGI.154 TaxID=3420549 RepID=UPI003CFCF99D